MDNLNTEIKSKIVEYLKTTKIGASSSEISKNIGHNRITVSKYLEIMKAHNVLDFEGVGQAKLWYVSRSDKPTVLVVDDEPHVVNLVSLSLIPEKFNIIKAYSGPEAIDKAHRENPDLVLLDLMMPGMSGYEVCQKLKENALMQHIPIIILSAKGEIDDKLRGLRTGADDYIAKPFDPMELEARVERMIRRTSRDIDSHPLTMLPGRDGTAEHIRQRLMQDSGFKVHSIVLKNLKDYGKKHGYRKAENVLKLYSRMMAESLQDAFIGHTPKDNFIVVSGNPDAVKVIKDSFERLAPYIDAGTMHVEHKSIDSKEIIDAQDAFARLEVV
jgi:DNA-binding response OmpR family regulator